MVVPITGSPEADTLNCISVVSSNHTGQAGFKSGTGLSFGSSEQATDKNDCEKEVMSSELLYAGGLALPLTVSRAQYTWNGEKHTLGNSTECLDRDIQGVWRIRPNARGLSMSGAGRRSVCVPCTRVHQMPQVVDTWGRRRRLYL